MRIAVLSDIHANFIAFESVFKDFKKRSIDRVVFLGDLVMTGPRPKECYDLMKELNPYIWLKGNTDDWLNEINESFVPRNEKEVLIKRLNDFTVDRLTKNEISDLIQRNIMEEEKTCGYYLGFCHGSSNSYSQGILPTNVESDLEENLENFKNASIIICGHTHNKFSFNYRGNSILNFGSISMPGADYCKNARYGIIEVDNDEIKYENIEIEFNLESFFNDMKQLNYPGYELVLSKYIKTGTL